MSTHLTKSYFCYNVSKQDFDIFICIPNNVPFGLSCKFLCFFFSDVSPFGLQMSATCHVAVALEYFISQQPICITNLSLSQTILTFSFQPFVQFNCHHLSISIYYLLEFSCSTILTFSLHIIS